MKTENLQFEDALREISANFPDDLVKFVCAPASKKLRPRLIFAVLEALELPVASRQMKIALAVEILHSATLIHDDIIDESPTRRGELSFYEKYGAKKSVILGDYLLSIVMKLLVQINSMRVLEIFSDNILKICEGEFMSPSDENYVEKITKKTALLFVCAVSSSLEVANVENEKRKNLEDFALNYGIAFQIKDDIDDCERDGVYASMKKEFIERAKTNLEFIEPNKRHLLTAFLDDLE